MLVWKEICREGTSLNLLHWYTCVKQVHIRAFVWRGHLPWEDIFLKWTHVVRGKPYETTPPPWGTFVQTIYVTSVWNNKLSWVKVCVKWNQVVTCTFLVQCEFWIKHGRFPRFLYIHMVLFNTFVQTIGRNKWNTKQRTTASFSLCKFSNSTFQANIFSATIWKINM